MSKVRAIFIDSEGTLRDSKHKIDLDTKEIIKELEKIGIPVIVTTGLPRFISRKISTEANASRYIISSNGADIYDKVTEKNLFSDYLDNQTLIKLYHSLKKDYNLILGVGNFEYSNAHNNEYSVISKKLSGEDIINNKFYQCHVSQKRLDLQNDNYYKEINEFIKYNELEELHCYLGNDLFIKLVENLSSLNKLTPNEIDIIIRAVRFSKLVRLKNEILSNYNNLCIGNQSIDFYKFHYDTEIPWFSLNRNGVSKGNAILKLSNYLGLDSDDVVAIGNDYNDQSMINAAGRFICPSNAVSFVKDKSQSSYESEKGIGKVLVKIYNECK